MIAITAYQIIMVVRKLFLIQPSIHPKKTKSYLLAINLLPLFLALVLLSLSQKNQKVYSVRRRLRASP